MGKLRDILQLQQMKWNLNAVEASLLLEGWDRFWKNFAPKESTCFFLFSDSGHQNGTRFGKYNLEWCSAVEVSRMKKLAPNRSTIYSY